MSDSINLLKISKMEGLAFKNALRLHEDSSILFKEKSYPTAFFLSVLAIARMIEHERAGGTIPFDENRIVDKTQLFHPLQTEQPKRPTSVNRKTVIGKQITEPDEREMRHDGERVHAVDDGKFAANKSARVSG